MHPAQSWTGTDGPQLPALPAPPLDSRSQAGSLTGGHCPSPSASLGPVLSQTPRSVFWVPCLPPRCFPPHPASLLSQFPSVSLCCLFVICFPCVSLFPLLTLFSTFLFLSLCALASVPRMNTFPLSEASGALGSWSSQVGARALLGLGLSQPGAALPCPPWSLPGFSCVSGSSSSLLASCHVPISPSASLWACGSSEYISISRPLCSVPLCLSPAFISGFQCPLQSGCPVIQPHCRQRGDCRVATGSHLSLCTQAWEG